ncbi:MAG: LacI family DNA-binding transcriptional regulator [Treponema sp.]
MAKTIKMKDIADALGVSTVTVSKALSDKDGVSEAVKETIKAKAEELGYQHHSVLKKQGDNMSGNIGIIVAECFFEENTYYSNLYAKIVKELNKRHYSAILEVISAATQDSLVLPEMLRTGKVEGLIILGQMKKEYISEIAGSKIKYVLMDFYNDEFDNGAVVGDNVYGTYLLTEYLISNGHKKIGFIGNIRSTSSILDRYLGYYKALIENNIELNKDWILDDRDEKGSFIPLNLPEKMPTAFVCNCDQVAFNLIQELKDRNYKIPQDISVVGFDDFVYATISKPQLTTFRIDQENMAESAVESVLKEIARPDYKVGRIVISGKVIIRDSVQNIAKN